MSTHADLLSSFLFFSSPKAAAPEWDDGWQRRRSGIIAEF
jgi:hypothetical protein